MFRIGFRTTTLALAAATALTGAASAWAQDGYGPPPAPEQGYQGGPYSVPPPPGYSQGDAQYEDSAQAREQDDRYSYEAEQWARENCVEQRENSTAAGAVIGGILGAIVGGSVAGRYDRGAGIVAGGALGAVAGGAIGNAQASESNPNCPPGFALRDGAEPFYAGPVYGDVVYEAPGWYDPWLWYGGHWIYRPYPYHRFWYEHHEGDRDRGFDHDRGSEHGDRDNGGDHGDHGDHDRGWDHNHH
jgi:uncharacterized protein YcfJ